MPDEFAPKKESDYPLMTREQIEAKWRGIEACLERREKYEARKAEKEAQRNAR